jgi:hypothetical protein
MELEFWILRFNTYPNALRWLDKTSGVAITEHWKGDGFPASCCLIISKLISDIARDRIVAQFPSAFKTQLVIHEGDNIEHHSYNIRGTISVSVELLKAIGGVAKNSTCYFNEISEAEGLERLRELRVRSGQDLSRMDLTQLGDLYRSLYP